MVTILVLPFSWNLISELAIMSNYLKKKTPLSQFLLPKSVQCVSIVIWDFNTK